MLTLNDGRSELWQWDTNRKLTVDAECSQVHFSNKVFGRSIDVDVVDGIAIIPDILLQTDKDLTAWAFVGTSENGYTKISKTFKVNRRNKPSDYVFTPTEQTSLEEILEKIEYWESIKAPAEIKNAVEDYLEKNPVDVQSVNGKTGAVQLSASDVGARPENWTPTAQEVGALPSTYTPPNQTAEQVGADPKGTATTLVSQHNTADDSHNDIRLELKAINDRLTAFFDSDDQTLDELSEIVSYITNNKTLIESITTSKVSVADIVNNLTTNVSNKPLSAAQGVVLKGLIDAVSDSLANYQPKGDYLDRAELPAAIDIALAQAKASGEFDGPQGPQGGKGDTGSPGTDGEDGVSATHSWNGTVLTITSASGTSSADLKGDKGEPGATGPAGAAGANATINGVNALTIAAGDGISASQSGNTLTIASNTIISQTDITAGSTALATGQSYHVYE